MELLNHIQQENKPHGMFDKKLNKSITYVL